MTVEPARPLSPDYWRARAQEARAEAEQMRDPTVRRRLVDIAENYDQLATQAEARLKSGLPPA
jgi:hypothetical protein